MDTRVSCMGDEGSIGGVEDEATVKELDVVPVTTEVGSVDGVAV